MDDNTISVSISDEEREFVDGQIAAGNFADDQEVLRAGLAALERRERLRELRTLIAEGDADFERGGFMSFQEPGELTQYILDDAIEIRQGIVSSENSGLSQRQIPDILSDVKARLRANGSL